jgi:hypothetical protein
MPRQTLYAYAHVTDACRMTEFLMSRFLKFISSREWQCPHIQMVNRFRADGHPNWQLGINVDLPDPGSDIFDWFPDIQAIFEFLQQFHEETALEFVVGVIDHECGTSTNLRSFPSKD